MRVNPDNNPNQPNQDLIAAQKVELVLADSEQNAAKQAELIEAQKLSEPVIPEDLKNDPEIIALEEEAEQKLASAKQESTNKLLKSISIVGVDKKVVDVAMDQAAFEMTENAKKALWWQKLWKHGMAREAYHFDKQRVAHKKILEENNIFANTVDDAGKALTQDIKAQKQAEFASATTERFLLENGDLVEKGLGEKVVESKDEATKTEIKDLIKSFAAGQISEAAFLEEKNRVIGGLRTKNEELLGKTQVDNILEVAKEIKALAGHQAGLEALEFDINLTLGSAEGGIKMRSQYDGLEKIIKKITSNPVGAAMLNETSLAAAVIASGALAAKTLGKSSLALAGKLVTFGLGIGIASSFAYKKEAMRTEHDRGTHIRELATKDGDFEALTENPPQKPVKPAENASAEEKKTYAEQNKAYKKEQKQWESKYKRRLELEPSRYKTAKAEDLISIIKNHYDEQGNLKDLDQNSFKQILGDLGDAIARNNLANEKKIDLICYSNPLVVETERTALLKSISRMKVDLSRKLKAAEGEVVTDSDEIINFRNEISELEETMETTRDKKVFKELEAQIEQKRLQLAAMIQAHQEANKLPAAEDLEFLLGASASVAGKELYKDITEKDKLFSKIKSKRARGAAAITAIAGTTIGLLVQELGATVFDSSDKLQGVFESTNEHITNKFTALGALRHFMAGHFNAPSLNFHDAVIGNNTFKLPVGTELVKLDGGLFNLVSGGKVVAENLAPNPDGTLSETSVNALHEAGISVNQTHEHVTKHVAEQTDARGLLDTWKHSLSEKVEDIRRLMWFDNNTPKFDLNELRGYLKLDSDGNYIIDVSHMKPTGSFHGAVSTDVPKMFAEGKIHILLSLSKDTQNSVIDYLVRPDGTVLIDKASEVGKNLFAVENGDPVSLSQYLEVALDKGATTDGKEAFQVVATAIGRGIDSGVIETEVPDTIYKTVIDGSDSWEMSNFIPVVGRSPLERLRALFSRRKKTEKAVEPPVGPNGDVNLDVVAAAKLADNEEEPVAEISQVADNENPVIASDKEIARLERTLETTRDPKSFRRIEDQIAALRAGQKIDQADTTLEAENESELEATVDNETTEKIKTIESDYEKYAAELREREAEIKGVADNPDKVAQFEKAKENLLERMSHLSVRRENLLDGQKLQVSNIEYGKWQEELIQEANLSSKDNFLKIEAKINNKMAAIRESQEQIKTAMIDRSEDGANFFEAMDLIGPFSDDNGNSYDTNYFRTLLNAPGDLDLEKIPNRYNLRNKFKKIKNKKTSWWKKFLS